VVELSIIWIGCGTKRAVVGSERRSTTALSMNEAQAPQSTRAVRVMGGTEGRMTCTGIVSSGRTSTAIKDSAEMGKGVRCGGRSTLGRRFGRSGTTLVEDGVEMGKGVRCGRRLTIGR